MGKNRESQKASERKMSTTAIAPNPSSSPHQPSTSDSAPTPDLDLETIPCQVGHAVLRSSDGSILCAPTGGLSDRDVGIIYRMLLEIGTKLNGEALQRFTISFGAVSYVVAMSSSCVYVVKKKQQQQQQ